MIARDSSERHSEDSFRSSSVGSWVPIRVFVYFCPPSLCLLSFCTATGLHAKEPSVAAMISVIVRNGVRHVHQNAGKPTKRRLKPEKRSVYTQESR